MSQSISSVSTSSAEAFQTSKTWQTHGGDIFNVTKTVEVMSFSAAGDTVDLSPDAEKAVQAFLASGSQGTNTNGTTVDAGGSVEISAAMATASTTGRQSDYGTVSDYDVSWSSGDGQSGELEVVEGWSLTTDLPLIPLSPELQSGGAPGITVTSSSAETGISVGTGTANPSSSVVAGTAAKKSADGAAAALAMLEENFDTSSSMIKLLEQKRSQFA